MIGQHVVRSEARYEGALIRVRVDTVRLANGDEREREIVEHPGAVAIVPVLDDGRIVLVRQYRPAVRRSLLELPAGTVEPDENVTATARRELEEETGYRPGSLEELIRFLVSPGWCAEELVVFVGRDLSRGVRAPEDDEDIAVERVPPDQMLDLIRAGEIADSKSIIGLSLFLGLRL